MISGNKNILISKCIVGVNCRFDCNSKENKKLILALTSKGFKLIPVCPEELGGLLTPRSPSFFADYNKNLKNVKGENVSHYFKLGAKLTLKIANEIKPIMVIFMDKSPSCGVSNVYVKNKLIKGEGITTHLLRKNGFNVLSPSEVLKIL